jgi:hypothetical protein
MIKDESKKKGFDTVKFFREVKERISKETEDMTFEELKEYINKRKLKFVKP